MTRRRHVTEDEAQILAHAMKDVRARKGRVRAHAPKEESSPSRQGVKEKKAKAAVLPSQAPVQKEARKKAQEKRRRSHAPAPPIDERTERKLRRGQMDIDATLDLHGLKQQAAHFKLMHFIARAAEDGHKAVLVITGKGSSRGDDDSGFMPGERRGVLRAAVPLWLEEGPLRPYVRGVKSAGPRHGGSGALYVLLKRKK